MKNKRGLYLLIVTCGYTVFAVNFGVYLPTFVGLYWVMIAIRKSLLASSLNYVFNIGPIASYIGDNWKYETLSYSIVIISGIYMMVASLDYGVLDIVLYLTLAFTVFKTIVLNHINPKPLA